MNSTKSILLPDFSDYYIENDASVTPLQFLPCTNNINIFIGTNNSGKSKFMRKLMSLKSLKLIDELRLNAINSLVDMYGTSVKIEIGNNVQDDINFFKNSGRIYKGELHFLEDIVTLIKNPKFYYIPTLRTAHTLYLRKKDDDTPYRDVVNYNFDKIEDDIFLDTLRKNYSLKYDLEVFTGIHLYKDILNTRNSKRETRKKFENFEKFISDNFFDGKSIDIISEFDKDESRMGNNTKEIISIHIEGEKESRDLFDLGDGIQALILLMYKIFMAENDSYIFIDEPEINLHPGMQRLFLEQILVNKDLKEKKLTYFLSTHSNHFLDLTLEKDNVSVYSFTSQLDEEGVKKLIIKNVNVGDNNILKSIGVLNSSVFMANCSIWVEGISDRIYIKAFLKSYCKHFNYTYPKEDIEFAFFEYAGTNLSHYIFDEIDSDEQDKIINNINAMALSNKILLIADSDNASANTKKGKRLKNLEDAKSKNFIPIIVRERREIENFLPDEVWEKLILKLCNSNLLSNDYDAIVDKLTNAINVVDSKKYHKKYIGEFLNDIRENMGKISGKFILNASEYKSLGNGFFGTLTNKRMVGEEFSKIEFSWDVLKKSAAIEKLTIEIYNFITQN